MNQPQHQDPFPMVPQEHGGKWVAWSSDGTRILSSGADPDAVIADALAAGEKDPILERVPPSDALLVGGL